MRTLIAVTLAGSLALQVAACADDEPSFAGSGSDDEVAALLHVTPPGGATDVGPNEPIVVQFNHPIPALMTGYAALHEGDVNGPEVAGAWTLSEDGTELVFAPADPLKPATLYTVHLGGVMYDVHDHQVDFEEHGFGMGGEWAWEDMFDHMDSGMGSGHHMGGDFEHPHMDEGWRHQNGAYGMVFSFTTAG